ncbi:MAG: 1-acyl-sn-glycerol-3-phosphate acyltransferase [Syntrophomonadaceae bacterium]|nr:1-acyl-sn-glycerol-3-phosphate acyltransferase [Bacillota bacterium]
MLYWVIRKVFRVIYRVCFRWRVQGLENIPSDQPFIICANHFSWWDPPLIACLVSHKPVRFMAKEELFRLPVVGLVLRRVYAFPVRRGRADKTAIRTALDTLRNGGILGLFPEGTRNRTGELLPPQPGIALIALKSGSIVLPVAIVGPYRLFRQVRVKIGEPLLLTEGDRQLVRAGQLEQTAGQIMAEIRRLYRDLAHGSGCCRRE